MQSIAVNVCTVILVFIATFSPLVANGQAVDDEVIGATPIQKEPADPVRRGFTLTNAGFDRQLVNGAAVPEMLRDRMELRLRSTLETIRKRCGLSETQCDRIEFAGRGDITRLIEAVERLRKSFVGTELVDDGSARLQTEIFRQVTIPSLQQFADSSLFRKVARRQLSDEQWEQYLAYDREQQEIAARQVIVFYFGTGRELTESQERAVVRLFLDKYPQWRPISTHIAFSQYVGARIACELEAELKPILNESQWRSMQKQASVAKAREPQLVKLGLWPIPGDAKPQD